MKMLSNVAIFRLQLFKQSETFIPAQVDQLKRYSPIYIGRTLFGEKGDATVVLPHVEGQNRSLEAARTVALRDPSGWLRNLPQVVGAAMPALLHAHFAVDAVYALPLARRLQVPLVTTLHGFDVTRTASSMLRSGRPALINGVLFRRQLQRECAAFLCVSRAIRNAALAAGFPEDKLRLHYIGIDTTKISPPRAAIDEGLIVHVARLVEKKGTTFLLQALAKIAPARPNAHLVIIGDGPMRVSLEAEAVKLGIGDRVRFLGMLPNSEVLDWDARAVVKVVPSITGADGDQEGFGIVNLEAAALGVPVVGFASGGVAEAVVHGETGLLSAERDVEGLAKHLALILDEPALRHRFGAAARARAIADFDIRRQTAKLEDIYAEVQETFLQVRE